MTKAIELKFGTQVLNAVLFDNIVANRIYESLPQTISLTKWGKEFYGSVLGSYGHDNPVTEIPVGGLCYTERGSFFCMFFGQTPAWPVEHIGMVDEEDAKRLADIQSDSVVVSVAK